MGWRGAFVTHLMSIKLQALNVSSRELENH